MAGVSIWTESMCNGVSIWTESMCNGVSIWTESMCNGVSIWTESMCNGPYNIMILNAKVCKSRWEHNQNQDGNIINVCVTCIYLLLRVGRRVGVGGGGGVVIICFVTVLVWFMTYTSTMSFYFLLVCSTHGSQFPAFSFVDQVKSKNLNHPSQGNSV